MITVRTRLFLLSAVLVLAGCKVTLLASVPETEANQMMALLLLRSIPAEKVAEKGGAVSLRVEKGDFVNAVEVLRQNGLPQQKRLGIEDLFPSNQLVTSPAQERAKMVMLKEQQLESMISAMDGVIAARVTIAQKVDENGKLSGTPSAAVFIKYSPQFNLANQEVQIRSLITDGVPGITANQVSVVMQGAEYRYSNATQAKADVWDWRQILQKYPAYAAASAAALSLMLIVTFGAGLRAVVRKRGKHELKQAG
ncbi:type III secretion system inner membrane ring lipoprotein SctJ [Cupriavidus pampae]|uniref:Lipoprotein n=1 Tax=Cupriavidus pampae TaxID=659251 RepID=A0ABM8XZL9_9BURK|nr:type III secretion inner membrane ring lipoprotein SctJ [Cupriavidus pampae]CAG9185910.1 hypothetical protein LMG32289_06156 [Cupriavidus pampae]